MGPAPVPQTASPDTRDAWHGVACHRGLKQGGGGAPGAGPIPGVLSLSFDMSGPQRPQAGEGPLYGMVRPQSTHYSICRNLMY